MMTALAFTSVILIGYLFGSIPFAVLIAKRHGVDIFKVGSCNPGATNVKRSIGKGAGNLCFTLDFFKGGIAVLVAIFMVSADMPYGGLLPLMALMAAILGHSYSVFMRLRGGKGVAVTMGGLIVIMPWVVVSCVLLWLLFFYSTRYVSLASILFGLGLPVFAIVFGNPQDQVVFASFLAVLIIVRHRSNIQRLLNGTENRFEKNG